MNRPTTIEQLLALTGAQLRDALGLENVYCGRCVRCEHCVRCADCGRCEDCWNCVRCVHCERCGDCVDCERCVRCADCGRCVDCIGCRNVHDKRYMVCNLQLTEAQYRKVRAKLGKLGEKP